MTDKEYSDKESIQLIMRHIADSGFTEIVDKNETNRFSAYDITANYGNRKVAFEVKEKTVPHTAFPNAFMRIEKWNNIQRQMMNEGVEVVYYVVIYTDGVFFIWRVNDYETMGFEYFPHTTHFKNNTKKERQPVYYYNYKNNKFPIRYSK